jgi:LacI family transcriptional regulator
MERSATIKDIALALNVSISTVSRALRGQPDIHPDTKKAVLALAEEMDYCPNKAALNLVGRHTQTIGVLIPNLDYFFATAVKGIDEEALKAGYTVMVCQSNESYERELINTRRLHESRVDGFIISVSSETKNSTHIQRLCARGMPLVFFDRDSADITAPRVLLNNRQGGFLATDHLLRQGCRRIAFLGGPANLSISNQRLEGYRAALEQHNQTPDDSLIVHGAFSKEQAYLSTLDLLNKGLKPDGIFAVSDRMAIGAMLAIREKGLTMPNDIALVGFNNEPLTDLLVPSISSIDQPAFRMGKTAATLLLNRLTGHHCTFEDIRIEPRLIVRESSLRQR